MTLTFLLPAVLSNVTTASLHGAVLIVAVVVIQRMLGRRLGPAWSFALWFLVLLRLSLPALPVSSWSWQNLADLANRTISASSAIEARPAASVREGVKPIPSQASPLTPKPAPVSGVTWPTGGFEPLRGTTGWEPAEAPAPTRFALWLGVGWSLVALGLLVRQGLGTWLFRRRLRRWPLLTNERLRDLVTRSRRQLGIRRRVELRISSQVETPCLFGVVHPVILLPRDLLDRLTDTEWSNILLHEFAHLKRWDPLWNTWMSVLVCLHWFNPLVWWAVKRMREDRELACDSLVLARADSEARQSYGATLLKLASFPSSWRQPSAMVGILEDGGPLKARLQSLRIRPAFWLNAALGMALLIGLGACALTRKPDPETVQIQPIDLSGHTDFPQAAIEPGVLQKYWDTPAMWSQIPKGQQTFFGVPFDITGLIRLAGLGPQREEWYFRPRADGIAIGRSFDRLYLLHATYYFAPPGTVIARARLNYADGTSAELPIKYGDHTLNYWRQRYEATSTLRNSDSRVVWTGNNPMLAEYGNSLRLCLSSFKNPRPTVEVRSVDLISSWQEPTEVVVGMAVGSARLPDEWREARSVPSGEPRWQGRLKFRAVDAKTGRPISGMKLRLEVAEPGVHSRINSYITDAQGWADIKYPHRELNYLSLWANHEGYVPRFIQWTRRQHGAYPDEYLYRAEPGVRITGRVEDQQGAPVAGAMVRIEGPRPDFSGDAKEFLMLTQIYAISDTNGSWSSSVIPAELDAEQITLRVLHPDFLPSGPVPLTVGEMAGATIQTRLADGGVVTGTVVNSQGQPQAGARVWTRSPYRGDRLSGVTANARGEFSLSLAPGPNEVLIQADGYAPVFRAPEGQPGFGPGPTSGPAAGGVRYQFDESSRPRSQAWVSGPVVVAPGRAVEIQVTGPQQQPLEGVLIEAVVADRFTLENRVTTGVNGVARWMNSPETGLSLRAYRTGFAPTTVRVPDDSNRVSVLLEPSEVRTGAVTDAKTGRPLPFFKIWAGQRQASDDKVTWEYQPVAVGRQGMFRITDFQATNPRLVYRFEAEGYAPSAAISAQSLGSQPPFTIALNPL